MWNLSTAMSTYTCQHLFDECSEVQSKPKSVSLARIAELITKALSCQPQQTAIQDKMFSLFEARPLFLPMAHKVGKHA